MHLGNVYAALMSYISAKAKGGKWLLRIEDIDPQRSKQQWVDQIMSDLDWLGLAWDEGPLFQSERGEIYEDYLRRLAERRLLYPCSCTRADLMATNAPHASDGAIAYSGRCRPSSDIEVAALAGNTLRLMVPPYSAGMDTHISGTIEFDDLICGRQWVELSSYSGDFVVRRRDGAWAYQFAVTLDDALMGVTEVVRGDDLLLSTAPQRYLAELLDLPMPDTYAHLPLLTNEMGVRLSKRDGALSMEWMRQHMSPRDVVAKICQSVSVPTDSVLQWL